MQVPQVAEPDQTARLCILLALGERQSDKSFAESDLIS
jgi:hypothetical protein